MLYSMMFRAANASWSEFSCDYCDILEGLVVAVSCHLPNSVNDIHASDYCSKNRIIAIQILRIVYEVNVKLACSRIRLACLRHCHRPSDITVFVWKFILNRCNRNSLRSCISSLNHKVRNNSVKNGSVVDATFDKILEVTCCNRHVFIQLNCNLTHASSQNNLIRFRTRSVAVNIVNHSKRNHNPSNHHYSYYPASERSSLSLFNPLLAKTGQFIKPA
jgi:hypothetical protein